MAGQRQPTDLVVMNGRKHLTKAEIEARKNAEVVAPNDKVKPPSYLTPEQKKKFRKIVEVEQVEKEKSAFDEYDRENGYEDEPEEPEENQWKVCGEIVDRVVKIAIRLLKNSYSQCMKENIVTLLEYLRFELDTINENQ